MGNGRSAAWQYPGEIPALQPYVAQTPKPEVPYQPINTAAMEGPAEPVRDVPSNITGTTARNVFVSMPKYNSPQFHHTSEFKPATASATSDISLQKPVFAIPEDRIYDETAAAQPVKPVYAHDDTIATWNVKPAIKRKPSISMKDFCIVLLLGAVIGGGYYLLSRPSIVQRSAPASRNEAVVAESHPENPVTAVKTESQSKNTGVVPEPVAENKNSEPLQASGKKTVRKPPIESSTPVLSTEEIRSNKPLPVSEATKDPATETAKAPAGHSTERAPVEKKKKLREVIKNIFTGKKAKTEEPKNNTVVLEEPRPATDRKAARRADDPPASSNTTHDEALPLADMMDISSNAPDNWMMGVSGLKITIRNRSQVVIQTAAVDVLYYDANNRLLGKKMVFFNHIPSRGKLTMAAPDDKWADHVDLKLSAVSAKDSHGYASN